MLAPDAPELRAVAPVLVDGRLVGVCTLVRRGGAVNALGTTDGGALRCYAVSDVWPRAEVADLEPVDAACINSIERIHDGSPTLVAFAQHGSRLERVQIAVTIGTWTYVSSRPRTDDADCYELTPRDPLPPGTCWEGAPVIVKAPAQRAVGLPARTMICAVATQLGYTRTEPRPLASLRSLVLP